MSSLPDHAPNPATPPADTENRMKNKHPIFSRGWRLVRYPLLFLILLLLILLGLFLGTNLYIDHYGVPDPLIRMVSDRLATHGIFFQIKQICGGFQKGLRLSGVRIYGENPYEYPTLTADELQIIFQPAKLFKRTFIPFKFILKNGTLSLPAFPESGKEGAADVIPITQLNAIVEGNPGLLSVERFDGKIFDFTFRGSGTFDNLLHSVGVRGGHFLSRFFSDGTLPEIPGDSRMVAKHGYYYAIVQMIPRKIRCEGMLLLEQLRTDTQPDSKTGHVELLFSVDMNDYRKTLLLSNLFIPAFHYGNLSVQSFTETIALDQGELTIDSFRFALDGDEYVSGNGKFNPEHDTISAELKGNCNPEKLLLFLNEKPRRLFQSKIAFPKQSQVRFEGSIERFSYRNSMLTQGKMVLSIPQVTINRIPLEDLQLDLTANDGVFTAEIRECRIGEMPLNGSFCFDREKLVCNLNGAATPVQLGHYLSPPARDLINQYLHFRDPKELISFSGTVTTELETVATSGEMDLLVPAFQCNDLTVDSSGMHLIFSPESLRVEKLEAILDENTKITGRISCLPEKQILLAQLLSSGSPQKAIRMLDPDHRTFLETLIQNIRWPSQGNLVELSTDIFLRLKPELSYLLSGSLVMTDFHYRNIPFKYGATRFIIDSNKILLLPSAMLESSDGSAVISVRYDASEDRSSSARAHFADLPAREPGVKQEELPVGKLDFSLKSTMSGNDVLHALYPEWNSTMLDFPKRIDVEAHGKIDYQIPEATYFDATVTNSFCLWNKIELRDVDATVSYHQKKLSFQRAEASISSGRLVANCDFDFSANQGHVSGELSDAALGKLLEQLHCKGLAGGGGDTGSVSGKLNSRVSFNQKQMLEMQGNGSFDIRGADLWSIPMFGWFFKYLGHAWSMEDFGCISNINCTFQLKEDQMILNKLKSDGGIVALSARGNYNFQRNEFDLRFRAELLRSILPFETIPTLLYPFSRALERRLIGKFSDYRWE